MNSGSARARAKLPRGLRLGPGAEFDVIRAMLGDDIELPAGVVVGPGDDCAVLESGDSPWAVTVDMSVEGVHFRRAWLEPHEIGWRSAAAALSDLAAADEVLLTSTSPCVWSVTGLDGSPISDGRVGPRSSQLLAAWSSLVGVDIAGQAGQFAGR